MRPKKAPQNVLKSAKIAKFANFLAFSEVFATVTYYNTPQRGTSKEPSEKRYFISFGRFLVTKGNEIGIYWLSRILILYSKKEGTHYT